MTVAVVEDDVLILDAMMLVLEGCGWEGRGYATGEVFLAEFEDAEGRPDIDGLLLDPHLPGNDGVDVARVVARAGVPFLVFTARPDSAVTSAVARLGARAVITKPVHVGELVDAIRAMLPGTAVVEEEC